MRKNCKNLLKYIKLHVQFSLHAFPKDKLQLPSVRLGVYGFGHLASYQRGVIE